ncbi:2328_t:CDS:2 [Entrophospora sp. SA101]|nr:2328_t:CDS:2 [Entrophospora sp. SA101]
MSTTFTKPRPTVPPKPARLSVSAQKHNSSYSLNSITTDSKNSTDSIITNGSSSSTTSSTLTITTNTSISEMLLNSPNLTDSPTQSSPIEQNHQRRQQGEVYEEGGEQSYIDPSEIYLPPVGREARALYDFSGEASYRELSFKAGDVLNVLKENLAEGCDSINSTTLMSSPLSTTTEVIVNGSTTTTTPSSARNSTILGRRQLNRFSWFVTTGVEEFILSGGQPLLTSENHSSDDNVHHHQIERSEDEDEEQITESDKHYIESGPSWQEKAPTFKVLVHNPEKRVKLGGVQEYTIFYVTSLFTEGAQVTVERRFSQFEWLHRHLAAKFSAFILPPLPEKQYAGKHYNNIYSLWQ